MEFDATGDPGFAGFVAELTDGNADWVAICWTIVGPSGGGACNFRTEEVSFGLDTTDLAGAAIGAITMRVDALDFFSDGDQAGMTVTLTIAPEPGAATAGAAALLAVLGCRRRTARAVR